MISAIPVTEANLTRISKGKNKNEYIIISVSELDSDKLKSNLIKSKYSWIPVYTKSLILEKFFVVYPYRSEQLVDFEQFSSDVREIVSQIDSNVVNVCNQDFLLDYYLASQPQTISETRRRSSQGECVVYGHSELWER